MLYDYCQRRQVPHKRVCKLVVATSERQREQMLGIMARARASGVQDLCLLGGGDAAALEPEVRCAMALLSPSTGILDSHAFMQVGLGVVASTATRSCL
jgi:L-2-hydroxyglutarate oxidase LhgO